MEFNKDDYMELLKVRGRGALGEKMGIEVIEASPERMVGTMPVEGNTQPMGLLHGGASVVLAESLGSIAAQLHAGPDRRIVGIEVNA
ncbi:MAG: hotdog fold thioesterase, partial [Actinobacteria bacterium]|nr:hotdog fold thioesterase [Actinomycetota bacterium]